MYSISTLALLTQCSLMTSHCDKDSGWHWHRYWLVAWWHKAITWTNVNLSSVRSSDVHVRILQPSITKISLKNTYLIFQSNLPGAKLERTRKVNSEWDVVYNKASKMLSCRPFGTKPFPQPMLIICQLELWDKTEMFVNVQNKNRHEHVVCNMSAVLRAPMC